MARWRAYSRYTYTARFDKEGHDARDNALLGAVVGFFVAYILSEFLLAAQPHPWHWLGAAVGTGISYVVVYGWLLSHLAAERRLMKGRR